MSDEWKGPLEKIDDFHWRIPMVYQRGMKQPGIIFADEAMLKQIRCDQAPQQLANVAHLPGLAGPPLAMPDMHWGYGFPIGGVAAMDAETGVISPGGVGYDINCGVRLVRTDLEAAEVKGRMRELVAKLYQTIPCGVGSSGKLKLSPRDEADVLRRGASWAVKNGFGWEEDVERTEQLGCLEGADPSALSPRALERGRPQLGTLGAGNHFLEIQEVQEIFLPAAAEAFGLRKGQITVMIHTGSRGLGYQVCDDNLDVMVRAMAKYKISVPDKQLACAPAGSPEGRQYYAAMAASANYAWTNRQLILHWVRESFERVLGAPADRLGMHQVYDVAHNIAKFENHSNRRLLVHRKGATRSFPAGHPEVPEAFRPFGQPVLIPGDMGTGSYVLVGTERAMEETYGSTCHGAGRLMSRHAAIRACRGRSIAGELEAKGVFVLARGKETLAEEAPEAYKNIDDVVHVVQQAGISRKVARLKPLGVVKG
jgi:tRNA-splicing ligase RtcB (3'-phosphate/5'-hydroxy nucleic acid ligase)